MLFTLHPNLVLCIYVLFSVKNGTVYAFLVLGYSLTAIYHTLTKSSFVYTSESHSFNRNVLSEREGNQIRDYILFLRYCSILPLNYH
jgi:hypothetical protein